MGDSLILGYNLFMKAKVLVIWLFCYLLGCFAGYVLPIYLLGYLVLPVILIVLSFIFLRKPYLFGIIFGFGLFFLSVWHFQCDATALFDLNTRYSGKVIQITARVDDLPQKALHGDKVRLVIVNGESALVGAKLTAYISDASPLKYGDLLRTDTKISAYKEETRWRNVSTGVVSEVSISKFKVTGTSAGILAKVRGVLLLFRQALNESISRLLPAAESGLGSGIILGEKALVGPEMVRALQASGTTHIIALSGYNITILMGAFLLVRNRLSRKMKLIAPISLIVVFVVMTGGAPSLVRAAIMGSLPLVASYLGRESDNFISILFSATAMAVFNPFLPLFDVGFQLSFVAFAGIVYISPLVESLSRKIGGGFTALFSETIGAQIATLPLLSYYFGIISVIAPLTNVVILALVPLAMAMTFAMGVVGMLSSSFGSFLAVPTYYLLHLINSVIIWSGSVGWASATYKIENPWWILLTYILIFDIWILFGKVGRTRPTE